MNIDFDALAHDRASEVERGEARLVQALLESMADGDLPTVRIPYEWIICDVCEGEGSHSRHLGVIDPDTWNDWEDDERHSYLSGRYDRACDACSGTGKLREIALEQLPKEVAEWIEGYRTDIRESALERYYERRAGC